MGYDSAVVRIKIKPDYDNSKLIEILKDLSRYSGALDTDIKFNVNLDDANKIIELLEQLKKGRYVGQHEGRTVLGGVRAYKKYSNNKSNGYSEYINSRAKLYDETFMKIAKELKTVADTHTELTIPVSNRNVDYTIEQIEKLYEYGFIDKHEKDKHTAHLEAFTSYVRPKV